MLHHKGWEPVTQRRKVFAVQKVARDFSLVNVQKVANEVLRSREAVWCSEILNEFNNYDLRDPATGDLWGFYEVGGTLFRVTIYRYSLPRGLLARFQALVEG